MEDTLQVLIVAAMTPTSRLPPLTLRKVIDFVRGRESLDGVPIPVDELPVSPLLRPAIDRLGANRVRILLIDLLAWCAERQTAPATVPTREVRDREAMKTLIEEYPDVGAIFEVSNEAVGYSSSLSDEARRRVSELVGRRHRPPVQF